MPPSDDLPYRKPDPDLVDESVGLLSDYLDEPRTNLLRQLAELIVELRSRQTLDDGRPDWAGRSPAYRALIAEVYERAGVPRDRLDTIQAALRYHTGNLIRERASREELLSVGLTATSPRDRNAASREALQAIAQATGGRTPRQDVDRLAVYAQAILEFIDDAAIQRLEEDRSRVAELAIERVQSRATELLARLRGGEALSETRRGGGPLLVERVNATPEFTEPN